MAMKHHGFLDPGSPDRASLRKFSKLDEMLMGRKSVLVNWNVQSEEERRNTIMKVVAERKATSDLED